MNLDFSPETVGVPKKILAKMNRYRERGFLSLSPKEKQEAEELVKIAIVSFKDYLAKRLFEDYPVIVDLEEATGVIATNYSMIKRTPRRMSPRTIGILSLYDSRYRKAIVQFRELEDFYFRLPDDADGGGPAPASKAMVSKLDEAQRVIDELCRIAGTK